MYLNTSIIFLAIKKRGKTNPKLKKSLDVKITKEGKAAEFVYTESATGKEEPKKHAIEISTEELFVAQTIIKVRLMLSYLSIANNRKYFWMDSTTLCSKREKTAIQRCDLMHYSPHNDYQRF